MPRSCQAGVQYLKRLVDRSGIVLEMVTTARQLRLNGKLRAALVTMMELGDMGHEVAQSNVAYMIEKGMIGGNWPSGGLPLESICLRALERSSGQGNLASHISVGDYYFDGRGIPGRNTDGRTPTEREGDMEIAASHYRAAAEHRHPRGLFNLGYMHSIGAGVKEDLHLAKRYFDMAAETKEAAEPAKIATLCLLCRLILRYLLAWIRGQQDRQAEIELQNSYAGGLIMPFAPDTFVALALLFLGITIILLRSVLRNHSSRNL